MAKRTYLVKAGESERLVKAPNKAQAVNHVVADLITANVATQDDLERLLPKGVKIEHPGGAISQASEGMEP